MGISSILFSVAYPAYAAARNNSSADDEQITISNVKAAFAGVERFLRSNKSKLHEYDYNKFWERLDKLREKLDYCKGYTDKESQRQCIKDSYLITDANNIVINIRAEIKNRAHTAFIESLEGKRIVGNRVEIATYNGSTDNQFGNELAKFEIKVFGRNDDTITPTCTKYITYEIRYDKDSESWDIVSTKSDHGDCPEVKASKESGGMFKGLFK